MKAADHATGAFDELDPFAAEPGYQHLARLICRQLYRSALPSGTPLPPLADFLPKWAGKPRLAGRALQVLRDARLVVRGPRGVPVVSADLEARVVPVQARFVGAAGAALPAVSGAARRRLMEEESGDWTDHLGACSMGVVNIDHRYSINGEFFVYSRFFTDAARFGALLTQRFSRGKGTFDWMLGLHYGVMVQRTDLAVVEGSLPLGISLLAQMPAGMRGETLTLRTYGQLGEPLYLQQLYIPHDRHGCRLQLPGGGML